MSCVLESAAGGSPPPSRPSVQSPADRPPLVRCTVLLHDHRLFQGLTADRIEFAWPTDRSADALRAVTETRTAGVAHPVLWSAASAVRRFALSGDSPCSVDGAQILRRLADGLTPASGASQRRSPALSTSVLSALEAGLPHPVDIASLAARAELSASHFCARFRTATGLSLLQYVNRRRIEPTLTALRHSDLPVREIAHRAGFRNMGHYRAQFRHATGMRPSDYRQAFSG